MSEKVNDFDVIIIGKLSWDEAMQAYHQERNEFSKKAYRQTSRFSADLRPMTAAALSKRGLQA